MKYSLFVEINAPLKEVVDQFEKTEDQFKWQPDLISISPNNNRKGNKGARTHLSFKYGNKIIQMVEIVLDNHLPEKFDALYEAKNAKNWVSNQF